MRNTLETKSLDQLHEALVSYNSYMCEIPEIFPILPEYLHGLSESEFCRAFAKLEKSMIDLYTYLTDYPESIGLTVRDKKTGEWKIQSSQHISCVKKLLYVLGRHGTLNGECLHISMNTLMNAYMTYYPNSSVELSDTVKEFEKEKQDKFFTSKHMQMVFDCLAKFGFAHTDDLLVTVEARDDPYAEVLEAVVVQQGAPELSCANENSIRQPLIPEMALNDGNQFFGFITDPRLACPADRRKILANLNVAQR